MHQSVYLDTFFIILLFFQTTYTTNRDRDDHQTISTTEHPNISPSTTYYIIVDGDPKYYSGSGDGGLERPPPPNGNNGGSKNNVRDQIDPKMNDENIGTTDFKYFGKCCISQTERTQTDQVDIMDWECCRRMCLVNPSCTGFQFQMPENGGCKLFYDEIFGYDELTMCYHDNGNAAAPENVDYFGQGSIYFDGSTYFDYGENDDLIDPTTTTTLTTIPSNNRNNNENGGNNNENGGNNNGSGKENNGMVGCYKKDLLTYFSHVNTMIGNCLDIHDETFDTCVSIVNTVDICAENCLRVEECIGMSWSSMSHSCNILFKNDTISNLHEYIKASYDNPILGCTIYDMGNGKSNIISTKNTVDPSINNTAVKCYQKLNGTQFEIDETAYTPDIRTTNEMEQCQCEKDHFCGLEYDYAKLNDANNNYYNCLSCADLDIFSCRARDFKGSISCGMECWPDFSRISDDFVLYNGGFVCGEGLREVDLHIMCNELDYVTYDSYILEDPNDMHDYLFVYTNFTISGIYCPQNALSFVDCETSLHEENCPSQMGIKLMCKNPEGFWLGPNKNLGYKDGYVCSKGDDEENFYTNEADAICQSMGFQNSLASIAGFPVYADNLNFTMFDIHCPPVSSFEDGLIDFEHNCSYSENVRDCDSADGVFLLCDPTPLEVPSFVPTTQPTIPERESVEEDRKMITDISPKTIWQGQFYLLFGIVETGDLIGWSPIQDSVDEVRWKMLHSDLQDYPCQCERNRIVNKNQAYITLVGNFDYSKYHVLIICHQPQDSETCTVQDHVILEITSGTTASPMIVRDEDNNAEMDKLLLVVIVLCCICVCIIVSYGIWYQKLSQKLFLENRFSDIVIPENRTTYSNVNNNTNTNNHINQNHPHVVASASPFSSLPHSPICVPSSPVHRQEMVEMGAKNIIPGQSSNHNYKRDPRIYMEKRQLYKSLDVYHPQEKIDNILSSHKRQPETSLHNNYHNNSGHHHDSFHKDPNFISLSSNSSHKQQNFHQQQQRSSSSSLFPSVTPYDEPQQHPHGKAKPNSSDKFTESELRELENGHSSQPSDSNFSDSYNFSNNEQFTESELRELESSPSNLMLSSVRSIKAASYIQNNELEISKDIVLGAGRFGKVFEGIFMGCPCAVKQVIEAEKDQYETEGKLFKEVSHHYNVCNFYGLYLDNEICYIVMEKLSHSLYHEIRMRGFSIEQKIEACLQISAGVWHLHRQKIVHGDLALRNILFDVDKFRCVVADFGLAHHVKKNKKLDNLPIRWLAPEVLRTKATTIQSDVWSLGIIFWEVWGDASMPFEEFSNEEIAIGLFEGSVRLKFREDWIEPVIDVINSCTIYDPYHRIETVDVYQHWKTISTTKELHYYH